MRGNLIDFLENSGILCNFADEYNTRNIMNVEFTHRTMGTGMAAVMSMMMVMCSRRNRV